MDRDEARRLIVRTAEKHRARLPMDIRVQVKPHTMRRIQWAVFHVRQHCLVAPEVLEAAGYRAQRKAR